MEKKIYVVGIGPGDGDGMTVRSRKVIEGCDVVIGYTTYVDLLKPLFPDKEFMATGMRQEIERCKLCFELAMQGKSVALACSGDAGIYGMAAPMYELLPEYEKLSGGEIALEVVGGMTAASSGAAVLGAPLGHDFCVISLSDLLTPWEVIERRLIAAIEGDFAIAIYNPSSHKRKDYLQRACEIMLRAGASPDRACGYVRNIGREGMESRVMNLAELKGQEVDMFTTVFIGNSMSYLQDGKLITKRGYAI